MQFFLGIVIILGCVFGGFTMANGNVATFWQPAEYVIILGAAAGSMVIGNSRSVIVELFHQAGAVIKGGSDEREASNQLLMLMYSLLGTIRRKGIKPLGDHLENPEDSSIIKQFPLIKQEPVVTNFIMDNLRMLSMDKYQPHEFEAVMEKEIMAIESDLLKPSKSLHKTGEAMPGFGILAAVSGIVITMQYLDGSLAEIGYHVAAALVGTFIGIFFCYCLLEPLAQAMHERSHAIVTQLESVKAMLISTQEGKAPLVAVDAGRRVIEMEIKPTFIVMEQMVKEGDISNKIINNESDDNDDGNAGEEQ